MGAEKKNGAGPETASAVPAMHVEVVVHRGTIHTDDGPRGPGESALVHVKDVARLEASGHVLPADYVAPAEIQDGTVVVKG